MMKPVSNSEQTNKCKEVLGEQRAYHKEVLAVSISNHKEVLATANFSVETFRPREYFLLQHWNYYSEHIKKANTVEGFFKNVFMTILQKYKIRVKWASANSLAWLVSQSFLPWVVNFCLYFCYKKTRYCRINITVTGLTCLFCFVRMVYLHISSWQKPSTEETAELRFWLRRRNDRAKGLRT